jgi:hypothetical protein
MWDVNRLEETSQQLRDNRLSERPQAEGGHRDAELAAGDHQRKLLDRAKSAAGPTRAGRELFQPRPAGRQDSELGTHKEAIHRDQASGNQQQDRGH